MTVVLSHRKQELSSNILAIYILPSTQTYVVKISFVIRTVNENQVSFCRAPQHFCGQFEWQHSDWSIFQYALKAVITHTFGGIVALFQSGIHVPQLRFSTHLYYPKSGFPHYWQFEPWAAVSDHRFLIGVVITCLYHHVPELTCIYFMLATNASHLWFLNVIALCTITFWIYWVVVLVSVSTIDSRSFVAILTSHFCIR